MCVCVYLGVVGEASSGYLLLLVLRRPCSLMHASPNST